MYIEVTLAELNNVVDSLNNIIKLQIPAKYAYRFGKIAKKLQSELIELKEHRNELYRRFGEDQEDGTIQIKKENMEDFQKEVESLLSEKIKLDFDPMPISLFGECNVSSADMAWLENFFVDDEGDSTTAEEKKEETVSAGAS